MAIFPFNNFNSYSATTWFVPIINNDQSNNDKNVTKCQKLILNFHSQKYWMNASNSSFSGNNEMALKKLIAAGKRLCHPTNDSDNRVH